MDAGHSDRGGGGADRCGKPQESAAGSTAAWAVQGDCGKQTVTGESWMTINGWLQIVVFLLLVLAVTKPLGIYMAHVFERKKTFMDWLLRPVERALYRVTGVDENHE